MRVLSILFALLLVPGVVTAQAPDARPVGSLAQLMRGIFFPNANLIFDVQTRDPEAPRESGDDGTVTSTFSGIYTGWQVVENAALALAEVTSLAGMPGRLCENGRPVPVQRYDWGRYSRGMVDTGWAVYEAARAKDRERVSELTNQLAGACENCHLAYRDKPDRCIP